MDYLKGLALPILCIEFPNWIKPPALINHMSYHLHFNLPLVNLNFRKLNSQSKSNMTVATWAIPRYVKRQIILLTLRWLNMTAAALPKANMKLAPVFFLQTNTGGGWEGVSAFVSTHWTAFVYNLFR